MVSDKVLVVSGDARVAGGGVSERSLEKGSLPSPAKDETLESLRAELDGYYVVVVGLGELDSSLIFATLAAVTGRVSEIRKDVYRHPSRTYTALRTQEIDPLLDECDRQFKFFSRAFAVLEMEAKLGGAG